MTLPKARERGRDVNTVLGAMFKLLAVAWRPPTAGPWVEAVTSGLMARDLVQVAAELELSKEAIGTFSETFATYEAAAPEEVLHRLRRDETRLFIGLDPVVENAEGTWLQREHGVAHPVRMINNHSVAVADFMKECGVVRREKYNDCIDYLFNELDFCGYLADRPIADSAGEDADAEDAAGESSEAIEQLETFIDEHLGQWVPGFCAEVTAEAREPFYRGLAVLTNAFVQKLL